MLDVVRYRFCCQDMSHVSLVVGAFHSKTADELVIVDVVDGHLIVSPDTSGFRNLRIYCYHQNDTKRHICEAQIVHR